ncbi:PIG-L deacetylase family protein [Mycolicibacterium stellerae]|uniref:PIG-L deacetylase family protein n=1 Tax=Mycolicibacterium stellerae TaxID=2358193 RepID=UPI000F0B255B|nr:PIG-L family deacetylase [Mycolicibacterium stellerae]
MIDLPVTPLTSIALIGAHCDDIAIGAGATLLELTREHPEIVVNGLVLTGGGTEREVEEKNAFAAMCGEAEVRLTVADLPDGELPHHWGDVKGLLATFRRSCEPELVIGPQRRDAHQDHRLIAELIPTEFRDHLILGYEIVKWESDLPTPAVYSPVASSTAVRKSDVLHECYQSQLDRHWFDREAFLGLMRVRGVQCHSRYAEAFVVEKSLLRFGRSASSVSETL